jgi:hypothetical protein
MDIKQTNIIINNYTSFPSTIQFFQNKIFSGLSTSPSKQFFEHFFNKITVFSTGFLRIAQFFYMNFFDIFQVLNSNGTKALLELQYIAVRHRL